MKDYTVNNPVFSEKIQIVEEDDLVNADNDTAAAKQLIENDLALNRRMEKCLGKNPDHGDSQELVATFDSNDREDPTAWTNVDTMKSGEEHKSLFEKISTMFKNVRYLYKLLGTTDISKLGKGTVTDILKELNEQKIGNVRAGNVETCAAGTNAVVDVDKSGTEAVINFKIPKGDTGATGATGAVGPTGPAGPSKISDSAAITVRGEYALDAREKNAALEGTLAHGISQLNSNMGNFATLLIKNMARFAPKGEEITAHLDYGLNILLGDGVGLVVFMLSYGINPMLLYGTEAEKEEINITWIAPYTIKFTTINGFTHVDCVSLRTNQIPE